MVFIICGFGLGSTPGDQAFSFIGMGAFSSVGGQLRYAQTATKTIIRGDVDGDGAKDFEIILDGLNTLTAGDFIL